MKSLKKIILLVLLMISIGYITSMNAQSSANSVIQFSGRVINTENGKIEKIIYANIAVKGTPRGTSSGIDGFFSLAVAKGETVQFSSVGYELTEFVIPADIEGNMYSKDIIMKKDTLFLPEAMIYPWPDKDFFKIEFLALEVSNALEDVVAENLSPERLEILREILPVDGGEVSKIELQQAAQAYYYNGQLRPQNVFNPLSWKKFIDAIKKGDFKKKE